MPNKASQVISYLVVLLVSAGVHRFVYVQLKRMLVRDYPRRGEQFARWSRNFFLAMDLPFAYLYFRSGMPLFLIHLTTPFIYIFAVWQAIMIMWAIILAPIVLWRRTATPAVAAIRQRMRREEDDEETNDDDEPTLEAAVS